MSRDPNTVNPYLLGGFFLFCAAISLFSSSPIGRPVRADADTRQLVGLVLAGTGVWLIASALIRRK